MSQAADVTSEGPFLASRVLFCPVYRRSRELFILMLHDKPWAQEKESVVYSVADRTSQGSAAPGGIPKGLSHPRGWVTVGREPRNSVSLATALVWEAEQGPPDIPTLTPCALSRGCLAGVIKLRTLRWGDHSGLSGWVCYNHEGPYKREAGRSERQCEHDSREQKRARGYAAGSEAVEGVGPSLRPPCPLPGHLQPLKVTVQRKCHLSWEGKQPALNQGSQHQTRAKHSPFIVSCHLHGSWNFPGENAGSSH